LTFADNEKVLAFHGPLMYEAKVRLPPTPQSNISLKSELTVWTFAGGVIRFWLDRCGRRGPTRQVRLGRITSFTTKVGSKRMLKFT